MRRIDEIVRLNVLSEIEKVGITQKALAVKTGLSPVHLNKLLTGKRSISQGTGLSLIADALNVDESQFYTDPKLITAIAILQEKALKLEVLERSMPTTQSSLRLIIEKIDALGKELAEMRKTVPAIPPDLVRAWTLAKEEPWRRSIAAFFLSGDEKHLLDESVPEKLVQPLMSGLDFFRMRPEPLVARKKSKKP